VRRILGISGLVENRHREPICRGQVGVGELAKGIGSRLLPTLGQLT
jgi:hypothetical protein